MQFPYDNSSPHNAVRKLRASLARWENARDDSPGFSSGCAALDRLLPAQKLSRGMLMDWLTDPGGGAGALALRCARQACRDGGVVAVIDRRFYPPAAAAHGLDPARLLVVHPDNRRDALWAAVQALRSPAVGAVWATFDAIDDRAFRRLHLAAHAGQTLGLLIRPAAVRGQPSWADLQLLVTTRPGNGGRERSVEVSVLRSRRGRAGRSVQLFINDEMGDVREARRGDETYAGIVASQLGDSASSPRSA